MGGFFGKEHFHFLQKRGTMSQFGVPGACARCGKRVYAAEQKLAEEKTWHNLCWSLEFKEREAKKKEHRDVNSYKKKPDVAPAYYRVADPSTGIPARMETRDDQPPEPTRPKEVATQAVNFCEGCGQRRNEGDKFCGGCGTPL